MPLVKTIAIGACPETVTTSPDGTYLYITHYDTCSVSAVNLTTEQHHRDRATQTLRWLWCSLRTAGTPTLRNVCSLTLIDTTTNDANDI